MARREPRVSNFPTWESNDAEAELGIGFWATLNTLRCRSVCFCWTPQVFHKDLGTQFFRMSVAGNIYSMALMSARGFGDRTSRFLRPNCLNAAFAGHPHRIEAGLAQPFGMPTPAVDTAAMATANHSVVLAEEVSKLRSEISELMAQVHEIGELKARVGEIAELKAQVQELQNWTGWTVSIDVDAIIQAETSKLQTSTERGVELAGDGKLGESNENGNARTQSNISAANAENIISFERDSAWSIPLVVSWSNLCDSIFAVLLLLLNFTTQLLLTVVLVSPEFIGEDFSEKLESVRHWRRSFAHDIKYATLSERSRVSCLQNALKQPGPGCLVRKAKRTQRRLLTHRWFDLSAL